MNAAKKIEAAVSDQILLFMLRASFARFDRCSLLHEFTEVESGKNGARPELVKATAACKKHKARLVIAKLDRLSRNVAFIATLLEKKVDFVAVDNLAAVAEFERDAISKRTTKALAAAKARGVKLGNYHRIALGPRRRPTAARAQSVRPAIESVAALSATAAAAELHRRGIATASGSPWYAASVIRARRRCRCRCLPARPGNHDCYRLYELSGGGLAGSAIAWTTRVGTTYRAGFQSSIGVLFLRRKIGASLMPFSPIAPRLPHAPKVPGLRLASSGRTQTIASASTCPLGWQRRSASGCSSRPPVRRACGYRGSRHEPR